MKNNNEIYYAHSKEGYPESQWQLLEDHLNNTADLSAEFADIFSAGQWGQLAGLWHDLGKFSEDYQNRLHGDSMHVDHSTAGAILAVNKLGSLGRILAYVIAGHHTGLPDWQSEESGATGLAQRLQQIEKLEKLPLSNIPDSIINPKNPIQKPATGIDGTMWIRMLFSSLVDADFLDTEKFLEPAKYSIRKGYPSVTELQILFTVYMNKMMKRARPSRINELRSDILRQCVMKANNPPGIFTLTVPTGGGKTLSSMAFALHHAVKFQKTKIIYVIPYTSIIEQTADQFRKIFQDSVIEHHSNFEGYSGETEDFNQSSLACENWDVPIIVTTSVQFFESLFASRTSRCRKLHNIINSVVILDEAQLLPPAFLNPILESMKELQKHYGVTLVLSTATQPALTPHKSFDFDFNGLPDVTEIMENPSQLYVSFKRVNVSVPQDLNHPQSWDEIANELMQYPSVLCIVNKRDDARSLFQLMPSGTIHLSALMCGAHRSVVIQQIKGRLNNNTPTQLISTQLVEAGVDIDFPVVYRALAGLDSIAQAAGRCNREGSLQKGNELVNGQVKVFVPPSQAPAGHLRQSADIGRRILEVSRDDPLVLRNYETYFRQLYWLKGDQLDARNILKDLAIFNYRTVARNFQIIDDSLQVSVLVHYGKGSELIKELLRSGPERRLLRKLQRFAVTVPMTIHKRLLDEHRIVEAFPGIFIQKQSDLYDSTLGLCPDQPMLI